MLLAETARLAPEGHVGGITGGVLAFTSVAMMIYPAIYGMLLGLTDSYATGFILSSIPAFIGGIILLRRPIESSWSKNLSKSLYYISRKPNMVYGFLLAAIGITIGLATGFLIL